MRRWLALSTLAALTALLAACSSASSSVTTTSAPAPGTATTCRTGQIEVTTLGSGADAGTVDRVFGFTNVGRTACTLRGYPRITALNGQGGQATAEWKLRSVGGVAAGATSPPPVTLDPGDTASATLSGTDVPKAGVAACPPGYSTFLVTPPGATASVSVADGDQGGFPGCSSIDVNPIVPGTTGRLGAGSS